MAEAYLRAKFHLDPSNRLATIHQRHRQDRTDRQRSNSIGRTVLQTVAQKCHLVRNWPRPRRHCVRWGPDSPKQKGAQHSRANFGPWPRRYCARWGPDSPPKQKGGTAVPRQFWPMSIVAKSGTAPSQFLAHVCCGQTAGWMKMLLGMQVDLGPGDMCETWIQLPLKRGAAPLPRFSAHMSIVAKRLDGSRCQLVTEV